jgi:hypothetical protein
MENKRTGWLWRLALGLCPTVAFVIFLSIAASRTGMSTLGPQIVAYLLPGHSLPPGASSDNGDPGFRHIWYCMAFQTGGRLVHFIYDRRKQVIRSASLAVEGVTVGDLILAWGIPTSFLPDFGWVRIYWAEKVVWVSAPLSPASPVNIIAYLDPSDLPQDRLAWRGFVTVGGPRF